MPYGRHGNSGAITDDDVRGRVRVGRVCVSERIP